LLLDQMALVDKHQPESVAKCWVHEQWIESLARQHLWRDDYQPVFPIYCPADQVTVIVRSGVAGGVFVDGNSRYSL